MADLNFRRSGAGAEYTGNSQADVVLRALPSWWPLLLDASLALRKRRAALARFAGAMGLHLACFVARCYARRVLRSGGVA